MNQRARVEGRVLVRLSVTLAARLVHDAGAAGEPIRVTAPRTLRALERGLHRLLSGAQRVHLMPLDKDAAAGLREHGRQPLEAGQTYVLALAFDRFGRGTFLLRPVPINAGEAASVALQRTGKHMTDELQKYLQSIRSLAEDETSGPTGEA